MKNSEVMVTAQKLDKRKRRIKLIKLIILCVFLFLLVVYIVLSLINNGGNFTVVLDSSLAADDNIRIYAFKDDFDVHRRLTAEALHDMDNISVDWLPANIDSEKDGSHNGDNYIAYTFYVENKGSIVVNYWEEMYIDAVFKNIDEAIRVMIIQNGERTIYAKKNSLTNEAEKDTEVFYKDDKIIVRPRRDFAPGDIDKYTIVIWLEGSDLDCDNSLIGGEIKMHMEITDENVE